MAQNPYQPPIEEKPLAPAESGPGRCPACGQGEYRKLSFTWWGGALGPRLFKHVKCLGCGTTFNSETGQSNNRAIAIYAVVVNLIVVALVFLLFRGGFFRIR